jgi:hypothetical protein
MNETLLTAFDDAVHAKESFEEILSRHPVPAILKARDLNNILINKFHNALLENGPELEAEEVFKIQEQIMRLIDEGRNTLKGLKP